MPFVLPGRRLPNRLAAQYCRTMRRAIWVGLLVGMAFPAGASAANSISVRQVTAPSSAAVVETVGTVDAACSEVNCRWTMQIGVAETPSACSTTNRLVFISDLQPPGAGTASFAFNYETPSGPRPETVCLRVFDTVTQGTRVVSFFDYTVPAIGGTFRPAAASTPATSGVAGASTTSPKLARNFALRSAGAALHRSLRRRYGNRWNKAGSRSVDCNAVSDRAYSCVIKFDGRTLRARVSRLSSGGIGINYS